jgi:hypothetical protein
VNAPRRVLLLLRAPLAAKSATSAESGDTLLATAPRLVLAAMVDSNKAATAASKVATVDSRAAPVVASVDLVRLPATHAVASAT